MYSLLHVDTRCYTYEFHHVSYPCQRHTGLDVCLCKHGLHHDVKCGYANMLARISTSMPTPGATKVFLAAFPPGRRPQQILSQIVPSTNCTINKLHSGNRLGLPKHDMKTIQKCCWIDCSWFSFFPCLKFHTGSSFDCSPGSMLGLLKSKVKKNENNQKWGIDVRWFPLLPFKNPDIVYFLFLGPS